MKKISLLVLSSLISFNTLTLVSTKFKKTNANTTSNSIRINEVESKDPNGEDWIEIINVGTSDVDVSGYFVSDEKGLENLENNETTPIKEGTILKSNAVLVLEGKVNFEFGLGKADTANLYNKNKELIDTFTYTTQATGSYSRVPDGLGDFVDQTSTKGELNIVKEDPKEDTTKNLVINEVNSQPDDWIELYYNKDVEIDLSNYELRDNSDDHRFKIKEGTKIAPKSFYLVDNSTIGLMYDDTTKTYVEGKYDIGLGGGDSVRLYNTKEELLDEYSWTAHASYNGDGALASYGRYPDGTGSFTLTKETKDKANEWYAPQVKINEIESDDPNGGVDYVEIINIGTTAVDISGWHIYDSDKLARKNEVTPVKDNTILEPKKIYVFEQNKDFSFGLGKSDEANLYTKDEVLVDSYSWKDGHANGVFARIPDGTGEFIDYPTPSKGKLNKVTSPVVINEVQSNPKEGENDWVELANPTSEKIDVSNFIIKDNKDEDSYIIKEGTTIEPYGFLVINDLSFGLGKNDSVRLYDNNSELLGETTWSGHTNPTWGLYPNFNGSEYKNTKEETPGKPNKFADIPDQISWPGDNEIEVFDKESVFLEDSSGLDFFNNKLYAVDNGTATFWILDVNKDGSMKFHDGYSKGKKIKFIKDKDNTSAKGPDAEGITVDDEGKVYLASERDNSNKGVNYNTILMVDPNTQENEIVASKEWDLTSSLPNVSANMGIESVEYVNFKDIEGAILDKNTKETFDIKNYPNSINDGIFFVALEDNGFVYAYVLNNDGTYTLINEYDSKLGGAMSMDFDTYNKELWVMSDNGYKNLGAKIKFNNGTTSVEHLLPPTKLNVNGNYEGFAISDVSYTRNGKRPVYRFEDGVASGALTIGSIASDYKKNYEVKGNKNEIEITSGNNLVLTIDGDLNDLVSIYLDEKEIVNKNSYKIDVSNSTITINNEFLKTLEIKEHTIKIKMVDGEGSFSFKLTKEETKPNNPETPSEENKESNNSKTYIIVTIVAVVLVITLGVLGVFLIKKFHKNK